eukprot:12727626-Ditylum_brightwellii.AAC.1
MVAYTHQDKLIQQDQQPFQHNPNDWATQPASVMKAWLLHNIPYNNHCLKVSKIQANANIQDIHTFMIGATSSTLQKQKIKRRRQKRNRTTKHPSIIPFATLKRQASPTRHNTKPKKVRPHKLQDRPPDNTSSEAKPSCHQTNLFETLFHKSP